MGTGEGTVGGAGRRVGRGSSERHGEMGGEREQREARGEGTAGERGG